MDLCIIFLSIGFESLQQMLLIQTCFHWWGKDIIEECTHGLDRIGLPDAKQDGSPASRLKPEAKRLTINNYLEDPMNLKGKSAAAISRSVAVFCLVAFMLFALKGNSQVAGTGTIQGTVADSSGAVVPGASITLTEVSTQTKHRTVSDSSGIYIFPNIPITTYDLVVSAKGFETYEQTGIVLEVGSSIAINPTLKVGVADVKVEVHAEGLALQTEDVSFKQTIDSQDVTEMPLNGRLLTSLLLLTGGSTSANCGDCGNNSKFPYQSQAYQIAGGGGNTTLFRLDGGDSNDYQTGNNLDLPFPDAIAQFSEESAALGAVGGMHSGGFVNIVTKSGTNSYHGDAFEFIRNNFIDATNFFSSSKDILHENQFGGTFGGKVIRDKFFLFAGYQREEDAQSTTSSPQYVPTAANMTGDFSASNPLTGNATNTICGVPNQYKGQLCDPLTGVPVPGNNYNNPGAPTFVKDPAAVALYPHLPAPTPTGVFANLPIGEVVYQVPQKHADNEFIVRGDYTINQKNNFYGRYFLDGYQFPAFYYPGGSTNNGGILVTTNSGNSERQQSLTIGENWTINQNTVNSAHLSGTRIRNDRGYNSSDINAASIGVNDPQLVPAGLQLTVSSNGAKLGAFAMGGGSNALAVINDNTFSGSDDLTLVRGKHLIVFGGEFVWNQLNLNNAYEGNGNFTFTGQYSANGPLGGSAGGNGALDFIEGALSSLQQSKAQQNANRGPIPSIYLSDTFHATKKLTLVGGIRWSPFFYPADHYGRTAQFDINRFLDNKISAVYPNAPPGITYYGDPGVPKAGTLNSPWQWDANVGATYDLFGDGKTVIRGGLAQVYEQPNVFVGQRTQQNAPFSTATSPSTGAMLCFSNPWLIGGTGFGCKQTGGTAVDPFPQAQVPTPATAEFPAQSQWIVLPTQYHPQESLQYTLSVQHDFPHGWQASIDYIGSKTTHTLIGLPISPAIFIPGVWGAGGTGCTGITTTGPAAVKPGAAGTNCSTTGNQLSRFSLTLANPIGNGNPVGGFGGVGTNGGGNQFVGGGGGSVYESNTGYDNYNGMIATVQHRLSSTFSLLVNYTWSKCLNVVDGQGDISGTQVENPYNIHQDYGRCGAEVRNIFNTTMVAKSAFPIHGIAGLISNNWELAPLFHITSGTPINVTAGSDFSLTDVGNDRPNRIAGVNPINYAKISVAPGGATYATRSYLNQAAFANICASVSTPVTTCPALGTYGNEGRNDISGPMALQFDSQISRIFPVTEKVNLDLRLEAFNVLNHPSFSNPSSSNPSSSTFGEITGTSIGARVFQGGLKLIF
jgi:hypothetical protein